MKVGILTGNLLRFVPRKPVHTQLRFPVKLDKVGVSQRVDKAKRMHAESLHHAIAAGKGAVRHGPHQHVGRFRHQRHKIPEGIVCAGGLRHAVMRLRFERMNQVRKLDCILDVKHRNVVADQVVVTFGGIKLDGKSAYVAHCICRAAGPGDGGKSDKDRGFHLRILKKRGRCVGRHGFCRPEVPVRCRSPGVDHALGNSLMVKVRDFFAQDEVFKQRWPT